MANPTIATSTTSLATVASGAVTFVTQPSLTLAPGVRVNAKSAVFRKVSKSLWLLV